MKKKSIITLLIAGTYLACSITPTFASSVSENMLAQDIIQNGVISVEDVARSGKYRREVRYGEWGKLKDVVVSKENAKSQAAYHDFIACTFGEIVGLSSSHPFVKDMATAAINTFYKSPMSAEGTYNVNRRSYREVEVNVLTGSAALLSSGYEFEISHAGKNVRKKLAR